jgi:hypothetical protein
VFRTLDDPAVCTGDQLAGRHPRCKQCWRGRCAAATSASKSTQEPTKETTKNNDKGAIWLRPPSQQRFQARTTSCRPKLRPIMRLQEVVLASPRRGASCEQGRACGMLLHSLKLASRNFMVAGRLRKVTAPCRSLHTVTQLIATHWAADTTTTVVDVPVQSTTCLRYFVSLAGVLHNSWPPNESSSTQNQTACKPHHRGSLSSRELNQKHLRCQCTQVTGHGTTVVV